jgi:DNA repair protein RadC
MSYDSLFNVSEVEIIYRNHTPIQNRIYVSQSNMAYQILRQTWDDNKIELLEQFKILLIDRNNSCLGISEVATGGVTGCIVDPRVVFAIGLKSKASGLILAHNHPSGNLKPSEADLSLTQKFMKAGSFLDIAILDHLIITTNGYYSFTDNGIIPKPF